MEQEQSPNKTLAVAGCWGVGRSEIAIEFHEMALFLRLRAVKCHLDHSLWRSIIVFNSRNFCFPYLFFSPVVTVLHRFQGNMSRKLETIDILMWPLHHSKGFPSFLIYTFMCVCVSFSFSLKRTLRSLCAEKDKKINIWFFVTNKRYCNDGDINCFSPETVLAALLHRVCMYSTAVAAFKEPDD